MRDDESAQDLLDAHLRALRQQIAARKRQRELEAELLALARVEFDRRCEQDQKCHRELQVNSNPPVIVTCELRVQPLPVDSALYEALPDWLIKAGHFSEETGIREPFTRGATAKELVEAFVPETVTQFLELHHDYLLPDDILEHPEVRDPAVQQHVAWLVAQGLLKVRADLLSVDLRQEFAIDPGAEQIRNLLGPETFERFFEQRRVWLPPGDVGDYRFSRDAREWSAAQVLMRSGVIAFDHGIRMQPA